MSDPAATTSTSGISALGDSAQRLRRLCVFLADLHGGGAERMMLVLAGGLADRGVLVDLVLARASGAYLAEVPGSVRVHDLGAGRVSAAIGPLAAYLRRERPNVLFTTLPHASTAAAVARVWSGVRPLLVVREATTPSRRRMDRMDHKARLAAWAMRGVYRMADGVVAVSQGVRDDLRISWGVEDSKVWTLYSPLVTPDVVTLAQEPPGHDWLGDGGPPVLLAVGSLQPQKGFLMLLDAVARLRQRREVRLVVLGEGPQRGALEDRAAQLGIDGQVAFIGFRRNPFAFMARADVFVLASEREGLPGALVQAMACGCPVVATDCPSGPAEVLEGGRYGRLVPVGDVEAMATAIAETLDAPVDAGRLRARADMFASGPVIDRHHAAFEAALAASAPRAGL